MGVYFRCTFSKVFKVSHFFTLIISTFLSPNGEGRHNPLQLNTALLTAARARFVEDFFPVCDWKNCLTVVKCA